MKKGKNAMTEFLCDSNYLVFPVSRLMRRKKLIFRHEEKMVFDLDIELDYLHPEYLYHVDMRRFSGLRLTVDCLPEMKVEIRKSNDACEAETYDGVYRPAYHFTAKRGWLNDPNGLFFYRGRYHLFFQFNPAAPVWGNMHWGHAVSTDLLHWEERACALFPDELGAMFSGSAIVDRRNVSGLKKGEDDPILLFYTAAGGLSALSSGKHFTQCVAFSTDGGETFEKYAGNPIIPHIVEENRDPKVIYDEVSGRYVLALFLSGHTYALFTSGDLLHWEKAQEIVIDGDSECPDFYPLALDGDPRNRKWVLIGAAGRYLVGSFDGARFTPETDTLCFHYGKNGYAAQTWSDIDASDGRRIRIAWNTFTIPTMPFANSMTFPSEMTLESTTDGPRLCARPVREIERLYSGGLFQKELAVAPSSPFRAALPGAEEGCCAYDISAELSFGSADAFTLGVLGNEVRFDRKEGKLTCGDREAPLTAQNGAVRLRLLTDTCGVEIYLGAGDIYLSVGAVADRNLPDLTLAAEGGEIRGSLTARPLSWVWPEN